MGPFLGLPVCSKELHDFGVGLLENIGIQVSWGAAVLSSVLGENQCYVLWLGFGLSAVSFKNNSMLSKPQ